MATWADLQQRVRTDYVLDVDDTDEFALTVERRDGEKVREQRVIVRRYDAWSKGMIEIRSAFGEAGDYDAASLLTENLHLPLGSIALHGRYLVIVQKECLEDLDVDAILWRLVRITVLADILEDRKGGDRF